MVNMMQRTLLFLSYTIALVSVTFAQTSTTKQLANRAVNTNGIPTLIYNCAKLPAICTNVNRRNALQNLGPGQFGQLVGNDHIVLNYDTDQGRHDARRDAICPTNWKRTHDCPETAPAQPFTVPKGSSYNNGGYAAARFQQGKVKGQAGFNTIADALGNNAGMIWTCDEWPPALSVEGGANANDYCAPANSGCGTNTGAQGQRSEQNFQSDAHSTLRKRISNTGFNPVGIWEFHFKTAWIDTVDAYATAIEWYRDPTTSLVDQFGNTKRSEGPTHFMVDEIYTNGTIRTVGYRMTEEERAHVMSRRSEPIEIDVSVGNTTFADRTNDPVEIELAVGNMTLTDRATEPIEVEMTVGNTTVEVPSPAKQHFGTLPKAPPLPYIDIARVFLQDQALQAKLLNPLATVLPDLNKTLTPPLSYIANVVNASLGSLLHPPRDLKNVPSLFRRDDPLPTQCGPGMPCPDGSCCNNAGRCGYGPANCGAGNCTNGCDATALCGRDSKGGSVSCPLNVCCSYYGYCGTDSDFCNSPNPQAPCQAGFGSCKSIPAPSCGGSSANARSIAYYQVANVRERQCNRITPAQINTTGLTHLNLAFASINPSTFEVVPGDDADVDIYPNFTALKSKGLETWIAIGGWDFNDPGATQSTWSDVASTSANRAAFIASLQSFMSKYGFQGVDIDWEYPGAPDRDGKAGDNENFVELLKEMRSAFGSSYGISATLPSSYWYLRWFDPKAMEPYVDFFGLMTYDLHGPWDAQVTSIGKIVLGQTNIPEIYNWTLPLWYDSVDPSKINLGLAYYGRGYTLADSSCNHVGCAWSGQSLPGPCTAFGGVMSLQELQDSIIPQLGIQPTLLEADMMKQLTWSDQWIGYDDLETIAMKKAWASSHCFGGTMIWSIDLYSGPGSGDVPDGQGSSNPGDPGSGGGQNGGGGDPQEGNNTAIVYIDPSIWNEPNPVINCEPPCTFILPPYQLPKPTTITFPLYTTSLDVAWSGSDGWTSTVETTTLTIPPVTTTEIEVWQYIVTDTDSASTVTSSFFVTSSVRPSPFVITDNPNPQSSPGVSHSPVTRTITPPPYPYTFTSPNNQPTTTSSTTAAAAIFPVVTFKPGKPGPICHSPPSICGLPCLLFCTHPCLLDCPDGGQDFPYPVNPNPPKHPDPTPINDPEPTGMPSPPNTDPDPPADPDEEDPEDPDEEDEDDECAAEFNLPLPTYDGPIGNPSATATASIPPPPPPPVSSPPPPPTKPSPNPATESLHCYNSGAMVDRGDMIKAIDNFCDTYDGTVLDATDPNSSHTAANWVGGACIGSSCFDYISVSVTVINGCEFTIDGGDANDNCGRILREATDKCDQSSTRFKQGGTIKSNCAQWLIDPNIWWD